MVDWYKYLCEDWYKYLCEVCCTKLMVSCDWRTGPCGRVVACQKLGNIQGRPVPAMWVFGGVDTWR